MNALAWGDRVRSARVRVILPCPVEPWVAPSGYGRCHQVDFRSMRPRWPARLGLAKTTKAAKVHEIPETLYRLGIRLALFLAWVTFSTLAHADALSESPFTLHPPTGWKREVIETSILLVDPKNHDCSVIIIPHASNLGPENDDSWLRNVFNEERARLIKQFKQSGGIFLNDVDQPVLERIASRTYAIHGSFLMKKVENGEEQTGKIRILFLLRRESGQEFISIADYSACNDDVVARFFDEAISNIQVVNANAKRPRSPRELQLEIYKACINHCTMESIFCSERTGGGFRCLMDSQACNENCRPKAN